MSRPLFIVFEGIDGSGTTTQARRLYDRWSYEGHDVLLTREPGGTPLAEALRSLVLDPRFIEIDDVTELLLYGASRRQHVAEFIRPALHADKPVISDRYTGSTVAYQGFARGLGRDLADAVNEIAVGPTVPDLVLYLDLPVDLAAQRRAQREDAADRLELEGDPFQDAVRTGYLQQAASNPAWAIIDASGVIDDVSHAVCDELYRRFPQAPFHSSGTA